MFVSFEFFISIRMFLFCLFVVPFKLNESQILFSSHFFFGHNQITLCFSLLRMCMYNVQFNECKKSEEKNMKWQAIHRGINILFFGLIWFLYVQHGSKKKYGEKKWKEMIQQSFRCRVDMRHVRDICLIWVCAIRVLKKFYK